MTPPLISPLGKDDWLAERVRAQAWRGRLIRACRASEVNVSRAGLFRSCGAGWVGEIRSGEDLEKQRGDLARALDTKHFPIKGLRVRPGKSAGRFDVTIVVRDPLENPAPLRWPSERYRGFWKPIPLGVDEDDRVVSITLPYSHLLIAGETGSGKGGAMAICVAAAALDRRVRIWGLDGTAADLGLWRGVMHRFIGGHAQDGDAVRREAVRVLSELQALINMRISWLVDTGRRKVPEGGPIDLLAIDELAFFTRSPEFISKLIDIVQRARKVGIVVVAATQRPSAKLIDADLREGFPYRLALRTGHPNTSRMILGGTHENGVVDASTIPAGDAWRGIGFLHSDGEFPRRMKGFWLPDARIRNYAAQAAERRGVTEAADVANPGEPLSVTITVPRVPESKHHKAGVGSAREKREWEDLLVPLLKAENLPRCVFVTARAQSFYLPQRKPERRDVDNHAWKLSKPLGDVLQDEKRLGVRVLPNDTPTYWRFLWEAVRGDEERTEITLELRPEAMGGRVAA